MKKFNNSAQFTSYMRKQADKIGISIQNAYITYAARTFLEHISKSNNGQFIVRGSLATMAYIGKLTRKITDVDLLSSGNSDINIELFKQMISAKTIPGIKFSLLRTSPVITDVGTYKMTVNSQLYNSKTNLGVDIIEKNTEKSEVTMPAIFDGDEEFLFFAQPFEELFAEKLCILIEPSGPNTGSSLNHRIKTFYDIYKMYGGRYDEDKLTSYFDLLISSRGKVDLESATTDHLNQDFVDHFQGIWDRTAKNFSFLDMSFDIAEAVAFAREFTSEELKKVKKRRHNY